MRPSACADLPRETRFYDLRHSCATLLRAQGVHLLVISRILGHSQFSTTADVYAHELPPAMREGVDSMGALLYPNNEVWEGPTKDDDKHDRTS